jgi:TatD DNase family protein
LSKFNAHTHLLSQQPDINSVFNCYWQELSAVPDNQPFSLSVHPYFLDNYNSEKFKELTEGIIQNQCFWAVGECGLDKNISFSPDFQISVLNEQYKFAQISKRPMIIHCVQSFELLLKWKKDKMDTAMLLHGFVRKLPLLRDLIKSGFYVSFGAALCQKRPFLHASFIECPIERLFLETDNQSDYNIEDIYKAAAALKNTSVALLEKQIIENKISFFNTK